MPEEKKNMNFPKHDEWKPVEMINVYYINLDMV